MSTGLFERLNVHFNEIDIPTNLLAIDHISTAPDNCEYVNIAGHTVPAIIQQNCLMSFWKDTALGLTTIFHYTFNLLDARELAVLTFGKSSIWMCDWLIRQRITVVDWFLEDHEILTQEEYSNVLRKSRDIECLFMYCSPPENFEYDGPFGTFQILHFESGFWVTFDQLMTIDAKNICINKSKLTSGDVNRYLKSWLGGANHRLRHLSIEIENLVHDEILDGIENRVQYVQKRRQYTWCFESPVVFNWSYELKRSDGVTSSIVWWRRRGGGRFEFCLCVWPDCNGVNYD